jgi:hypothetical protein
LSLLLVFLDGVGVGADDPDTNPFVRFRMENIEALMPAAATRSPGMLIREESQTFSAIDANLGVDGLPQSGTGQASLFTGVNCAQIAGRHFGPFPHSSTRPTLAEHNVFGQVNALRAGSSAFANAYPPRFFEVMRARDRWTVTTRCCLDARIPIRDLDDLRDGKAISADITGERLASAGFDVSAVTEDAAARSLVELSRSHRLTVFEYFMTDKVGHSRSFDDAQSILRSLDRFLGALITSSRRAGITLLVTSDHGNMEDLSRKTHTRNPVPFIAVGPAAPLFGDVASLLDVTPAIVAALVDSL